MAALQKYVTENISGEQQNMQHDRRILDPTVAALLQFDFAEVQLGTTTLKLVKNLHVGGSGCRLNKG